MPVYILTFSNPFWLNLCPINPAEILINIHFPIPSAFKVRLMAVNISKSPYKLQCIIITTPACLPACHPPSFFRFCFGANYNILCRVFLRLRLRLRLHKNIISQLIAFNTKMLWPLQAPLSPPFASFRPPLNSAFPLFRAPPWLACVCCWIAGAI